MAKKGKKKSRKKSSRNGMDAFHRYKKNGVEYLLHGRPDLAIEELKKALEIGNGNMEANHFYGLALHQTGSSEAAAPYIEKALERGSDNVMFNTNSAPVFLALHDYDKAEACCQRAIQAAPQEAPAYVNLGNIYEEQERFTEAIFAFSQAITFAPSHADAYSNLGAVFQKLNRLDDAIASYRRAVQINPQHVKAHWNLALGLLMTGAFEEGWKEHEWRLKDLSLNYLNTAKPLPSFTGEERIFVIYEQGQGDVIQFARFFSRLKEKAKSVIVQCPQSLVCLLEGVAGVDGFVTSDNSPMREACDRELPIMSICHALQINKTTELKSDPYLRPDQKHIDRWANELPKDKYKIGLVWAGSPTHTNDHNRSIPFAAFEPLIDLPGVNFYSMQKGEAARESAVARDRDNFWDFTDQFDDFADTAAFAYNMDLVISVDTSVLHMCGAMGIQTWALTPFAPDWRWMLGRRSTIWYRSVRLFRQPEFRDWDSVFSEVEQKLRELVTS